MVVRLFLLTVCHHPMGLALWRPQGDSGSPDIPLGPASSEERQGAVFSCRADEGIPPDPYFGLKYIGVGPGGTLELHGQKKLSWTFLNKTLHPGGMEEGGYYFERSWGHRGVIVHEIDPKSGTVIHSDR